MKKPLIYAVLALLLISCGGGKSIVSIDKTDLKTREIMAVHRAAFPEFKTLAARVQLTFEDEEKQQSIGVSLRMEKDQVIWVKASILGITLAKVLVTPERVQYYETFGGTYFDGDFSLLSEWLGTELDFEKVQDLLLGQSIFSINPSQYSVELFQGNYKVQPKQQPMDFIHSLLFDAQNLKVLSTTLSQPSAERLLSLRYAAYQKLPSGFYPSEIIIDTSEKGAKTKIGLSFRKIDENPALTFPFEIPDGYEEIQLNE